MADFGAAAAGVEDAVHNILDSKVASSAFEAIQPQHIETHTPSVPTHTPSIPTHAPSIPTHTPSIPTQSHTSTTHQTTASSVHVPHNPIPTTSSTIPQNDPVCDLLLWKNPIETGKIFGAILLALLVLRNVNFITFFLRLFYTIFFITGSIEFGTQLFLGQGLITKYGIKDCPNTVGFLKPRIDALLKQLPVKQAKMRGLVFAHSPKNTFKAAGITWLLHKFFSYFSVSTVLILSVISAFTLPIIYNNNRTTIDSALNHGVGVAHKHGKVVGGLVRQKADPLIKKMGPISSKFTSKRKNANVPQQSNATATGASTHL